MDALLVPVPVACHLVGIRQTKLYELIAAKKLRARKLGKRILVETASIREFVEALPAAEIRITLREPKAPA